MEVQTTQPDVRQRQEVRFTGRSIAPGLGMGLAWVVGDVLRCDGDRQEVSPLDVDREWGRLKQSFDETLAELEESAKRIEEEFDSALAGIFRAHGTMLRELLASGEFERELRTSLLTAEAAVRRVLHRWHKKFEAIENQAFRQRADDVLDLGRNVIRRLRGEADAEPPEMPENSVLVIERL
ncbi:MAG TPA: phosphoenolpyruvate-utilizing N-terminal domain-containing protein, partial [Planctomycetaceae bacterium]|nr:phosphoenolpyruvate-utilizing N-terminal domain-containing protein [Planctomycetaceae bacterium]